MTPPVLTELVKHGIAITDGSKEGVEAGLLFCNYSCERRMGFGPHGILRHMKSNEHRINFTRAWLGSLYFYIMRFSPSG